MPRVAQVSRLMHPAQPIEQPWNQMPARRPGPSTVTGKCSRFKAIVVIGSPPWRAAAVTRKASGSSAVRRPPCTETARGLRLGDQRAGQWVDHQLFDLGTDPAAAVVQHSGSRHRGMHRAPGVVIDSDPHPDRSPDGGNDRVEVTVGDRLRRLRGEVVQAPRRSSRRCG